VPLTAWWASGLGGPEDEARFPRPFDRAPAVRPEGAGGFAVVDAAQRGHHLRTLLVAQFDDGAEVLDGEDAEFSDLV
jgi:hypothetical protein